ncbi:LutC/YkgG family protein [Solibacillus sp. FSL K6-1523]|uniref:LutC/YkgG family protein n=1 Tax=Solibacillus sp. FSL K6-1523 TaxID=2921471 RepID=UPI0030F60096
MIQNREAFLQTIATQLGHSKPSLMKPERNWKHLPQHEVLKEASADELVEILVEHCANIHTTVKICSQSTLKQTLEETFATYNNGQIIYSDDARFEQLQIESFIAAQQSFKWDPTQGDTNIEIAERANIGLVISDITLAESATIMLQSSAKRGRTLSFLPENSIAIIPKSSIVPRMTQAAEFLRKQSTVASCVSFITGPSNSADIEMNLVVGVHGPVRMTYIIVEDF